MGRQDRWRGHALFVRLVLYAIYVYDATYREGSFVGGRYVLCCIYVVCKWIFTADQRGLPVHKFIFLTLVHLFLVQFCMFNLNSLTFFTTYFSYILNIRITFRPLLE